MNLTLQGILGIQETPVTIFLSSFISNTIRYSLIAGGLFVILNILFKAKFQNRKIQDKPFRNSEILREFKNSCITNIVYGLIGVLVYDLYRAGYTKLYVSVDEYGWLYLFASFPVLIIVHDAYFYWVHRMMHTKSLYKYFHKVHHQSLNPTPWAIFSFHPLEAIMQAGIIFVIFILPVNIIALLLFNLTMNIVNVMGHSGFELFPSGFTTGKISKWVNTSVHHNMHHKYFNANYGLYFNFWDRVCNTNHERYHEVFEEVVNREESFENKEAELPVYSQIS